MSKKTAVLLMSFGTPLDDQQLVSYYTHIRHGHQPTSQMVETLRKRYEAIGGLSPLAKVTRKQVEMVKDQLQKQGFDGIVALGNAHVAPMIETVVKQLVEQGVSEIFGLPLAAQYSSFNARMYHGAAKKVLADYPQVTYHEINGLWDQPALQQYWEQAILQSHDWLALDGTKLLFSAHSLPQMILEHGDPYKKNVEANVLAIAKRLHLASADYQLGWQSAGKGSPIPWIGPNFEDVARNLVKAGTKQILSVPLGFINDNLEIDYDVDIVLKQIVEANGAQFKRAPMPNDDPLLGQAIANKLLAAGLLNN